MRMVGALSTRYLHLWVVFTRGQIRASPDDIDFDMVMADEPWHRLSFGRVDGNATLGVPVHIHWWNTNPMPCGRDKYRVGDVDGVGMQYRRMYQETDKRVKFNKSQIMKTIPRVVNAARFLVQKSSVCPQSRFTSSCHLLPQDDNRRRVNG